MAETLGLAVNIATVIDLLAKLGVHCSAYCARVKAARSEVRDILREADRVAAILQDVERFQNRLDITNIKESRTMWNSINDCQKLVHEVSVRLLDGTKLDSLLWPFRKSEVQEIVGKLQRHRGLISLNLQLIQATTTVNIRRDLLLTKLRIVERAGFDAHADTDMSKCYPGTRIDIIEQVLAWVNSCGNHNVFWLCGKAGTGKSTLSRTLAQKFSRNKILGASFFFKRGEGDRGRAAFFFPTLAAQLIRHNPALAPHVQEEIDLDPNICNKSLRDQFDKLIITPLKKVSKSIQPAIVAVVIDALDECDNPDDVKFLLHLLASAKRFGSLRLKLLIASRPDLPVQLGFKNILGKYDAIILQDVPEPIIESDISIFLRHELAEIRRNYNMSVTPERKLSDDWPGPALQQLVDRSVPLFISAATICRFLRDRRLGGPQDQLTSLLAQGQSQNLNLDATYLPVLDHFLSGLPQTAQRTICDRFKMIVGSIVVLANPLSVSALAQLLGISAQIIEAHLDNFHSVLNIPATSTSPVRLLHLSFRDFLLDTEKSQLQERYPFWVDARQTHERLATRCLYMLSTGDALREDLCDLRQPGASRTQIAQDTIDVKISPEVQYACQYWVFHWKSSGRSILDDGPVDTFLRQHLLHWLEALSLLGRIKESVGMVNDLLSLVEVTARKILSFLRDIQRVILAHSTILDIHPLQIYSSALVFVPKQSTVRHIFQGRIPTWLCQLPQINLEWSACLQTLEGHSSSVRSVAFSPDSRRLASASDDKTVKVWDAVTGACLQTLEGHSDRVMSVAFSYDPQRLASASDDRTVRVWDPAIGACLKTLEGHGGCVRSIAFSSDSQRLASASSDETVRIWDTVTGACLLTLEDHGSYVASVAFSPDSKRLVSGADKTVKIWDTVTGTCLRVLEGHRGSITSVAFSYDSQRLASSSDDGTVRVWDATTGACLQIFKGNSSLVSSIAFSSDSQRLVSASYDKTLRVWDAATGVCLRKLEGHDHWVESTAFSPDSQWLASGSYDHMVRVWDVVTGVCEQAPEGHDSPVLSNAFLSDSGCPISVAYEAFAKRFGFFGNRITYVTFSPDSQRLASTSIDKTIRVWDAATGTCLKRLEGHRAYIRSIAFSNDSQRLASASDDRTIRVWDTATGACLEIFEGHSEFVTSVTFSSDSQRLASACSDNTVRLWDTETGACLQLFQSHSTFVMSVAFSQDSKRLVSASQDSTVMVWDAATGTCVQTFEGHSDSVMSVAFSSDSQMLASAASDKTVKVWDAATGICLQTINGYEPTSLVFDATNTLIHTNVGSFEISRPSSGSDMFPNLGMRAERRGVGFSQDFSWVTWDAHKILWLPPSYRPAKCAVSLSRVAIGSASGQILIIGISPTHLPTLR